jgi:hypothetical protein
MTARNPIPDCLSHLRQLRPARTAHDDQIISGLREIAEWGLDGTSRARSLLEAADRLEELLDG